MEALIGSRTAAASAAASRSCFLNRLQKLQLRLGEQRLQSLLVGALPNVHYLTGFSGSAGAVLVTPAGATFFTDSRYDLQAHQEVEECKVRIVKGDPLLAAAKAVAGDGRLRIGFESGSVSYESYLRLKDQLPKAALVRANGWVEALRMQKEPGEIDAIRQAVQLGSRAYEETLPLLRPGITETEVAAEIEYRMRKYGGERPSFETIVAFGPRTALPHARPGIQRLRGNEFILMDLGVILSGYASDMTRTVFLGRAPKKAARMYKAVLEAQVEAEQAVKAGRACSAVDLAARRALRRYGYAKFFTHSTGHGLGREVHELPRIGRGQQAPLLENAVITVEPGVYIPGYGGVRIEDVVLVRQQDGEVLTETSKELIEL